MIAVVFRRRNLIDTAWRRHASCCQPLPFPDLEIRFKGKKLDERINVKLQVEGKQLTRTFGKKEAVKWALEGL